MKHPFCRRLDRLPRGLRSFTLVELLVVLAIIAILAVMIAPSVNGVLGTMNLKGATAAAVSQIDLARQTAMTRNIQTELRLYQDTNTLDIYTPGTPYAFRYTAVVISTNASGATTDEFVSPGQGLPGDSIFDQTGFGTVNNFSSMLDTSQNDSSGNVRAMRTESVNAPLVLRNLLYQRVVFQPNGTVNLSLPSTTSPIWCLSLRSNKAKPVTTSPVKPAKNFATLVLDPATGRVRVYTP